MPRKPKPSSTPAATPPPAPTPKRTRQRLPARQRALDALKVALAATEGDEGCAIAGQNFGEMIRRLPADYAPRSATARGPLQAGDWCEAVDKVRGLPPHSIHAAPYKLTATWERGRVTYCQIEDQDGRTSCCPLSDLRRCAPPAAVPDVPAGDPAALGVDAPMSQIVDLAAALKDSLSSKPEAPR